MKRILPALLPLVAAAAHGHPGHAMPGTSHWHMADGLPWVLATAIAAGVAWWLSRK